MGKIKRQGLVTSINELEILIRQLSKELHSNETKVQLNIINKSGLSDEWEFEK